MDEINIDDLSEDQKDDDIKKIEELFKMNDLGLFK